MLTASGLPGLTSYREIKPARWSSGVVLRGRAGEATPLAVAFDLTVTRERGVTRTTKVVQVV